MPFTTSVTPLSSTSVTSIALTVSTNAPTNPNVYSHELTFGDIIMGQNKHLIPSLSDVHKGLHENDAGTSFLASVNAYHAGGLSTVKSTSSSLFTPDPISTQVALTPIVAKYGDTPISLTDYVTTNSKGVVTYIIGDTSIANVSPDGNKLNILKAGNTTIYAKQAASGLYLSAVSNIVSLIINPIAPTFTFYGIPIKDNLFPISSQNVRASPFTITPTPDYPISNSTGAYSYTSSSTTVATVDATGAITVKTVGTTTITVSQAATNNYISGSVQASLVVNAIAPTFTFGGDVIPTGGKFTITSPTPGATTFRPTYPTSSSKGAYSYASSNTDIATVSTTGDITIKADGTVNIIVTQAAEGNYTSRSVNGSLRVMYKWIMQGQDINGEIANDQSGTSVSLSADGTIVAVGAPYNNGNGSDSGHVRVYKLIGSKWTQQGGDINGEASGDKSGYSVSLSKDGTIVAIGAPKNNNANGTDAGQVRVFKYNANKTTANSLGPAGWDQQGGDINGEDTNDESGTSVSLSENGLIVAIGALNNDAGGSNAGHVRVFKYNAKKTTANSLGPAGWDQQGGDINGEDTNDESGISVSLSADGSIVAIGGNDNDGNGNGNGIDYGHVRVYKLIGSKWTRQGGDIDGESANDESGTSVSLSKDGTIVAIGAPKNNNVNGNNSGQVRVFKYNANKTTANSLGPAGWDQQGGDINGENADDESGSSVSLSGDGLIVAIGGPKNNGNGSDSGHVRVYKLIGGAWIKQDGDIDGEASTDESGRSVSISRDGLIVAIGAPNNNSNESGHVRVYKYMLSA